MTTDKSPEAVVAKWLPIPGFEGLYEISDDGQVKSLTRRVVAKDGRSWSVPTKILSLGLTRKGYPSVSLWKNGLAYPREVHRLVCRAFHGEPEEWQEASHVDGVRTNCSAANLAWKSRSENHADKRLHGTHLTGAKVPYAKLTERTAIAICPRALMGESMRALAREFSVDEAAVRKIKAGKMWADQTLAVRALIQDNPS